MGPEGELRVGLHLRAMAVQRVDIASTRPDVARSILQGRTRAEVATAVPLLFAICARSQAAASELACAAAAGEPISPAMIQRRSLAVAAENLREGAWRTLLDWPQWLGERPCDEAVAAARASLAGAPVETAELACAANAAIAMAVFGVSAHEWLEINSRADLARWVRDGRTASARFIGRVQDEEAAAVAATGAEASTAAAGAAGAADPSAAAAGVAVSTAAAGAAMSTAAPGPAASACKAGPTTAPFLPAHDHAEWMGEIANAIDADTDFDRHPTWRGAPAETGALARGLTDPLLADLAAHPASRVQARFTARLRELAWLLVGRTVPAVGALGAIGLAGNGAVSWVETARGLLVHRVTVHDGRVVRYRIVAPTEWNFHPRGALAMALAGAGAADTAVACQTASRIVHSLDPCVACRVEVANA